VALAISTESFARFERLSFVARRDTRAGLGGEHRSRRPSPSTDFVDFRPYQPGDDFRRVDWNAYGRLGTLHVKLTEGRERLDVVLVLDCSSSMASGAPDKLQFGAQLVAALASIGMARSDAVRIVCLTPPGAAPEQPGRFRFGPFSRRGRLPDVVTALQRLAPTGLVDLNDSLAGCLPEPLRQPLVVVVSDLMMPEGVAAGLSALQTRRADVAVIHVVSADELRPDLSGELELVDSETNQVLELGVSQDTLRAYRARFDGWLQEREADCTTRGLRYARVVTDRPLSSVIMDDLRQASLLR
jgi:uncharacterized protein (DUF58 family)